MFIPIWVIILLIIVMAAVSGSGGDDDFMWPNVGLILKGCKRRLDPSHTYLKRELPLPPEEIERKRQAALNHLENIKNILRAKS